MNNHGKGPWIKPSAKCQRPKPLVSHKEIFEVFLLKFFPYKST